MSDVQEVYILHDDDIRCYEVTGVFTSFDKLIDFLIDAGIEPIISEGDNVLRKPLPAVISDDAEIYLEGAEFNNFFDEWNRKRNYGYVEKIALDNTQEESKYFDDDEILVAIFNRVKERELQISNGR